MYGELFGAWFLQVSTLSVAENTAGIGSFHGSTVLSLQALAVNAHLNHGVSVAVGSLQESSAYGCSFSQ